MNAISRILSLEILREKISARVKAETELKNRVSLKIGSID